MKIGIVITHEQDQKTGHIPSYTAIQEMAQAADASSLDSIWLFDHLLFRFDSEATQGIWECWTLLSALAAVTNKVALGTLVLCTPFRNPALLAKMAHTLDEVSNGRLILGVGAGWHQPEFDAFGYSFEKRVDRFEEALQILQPLLKGKSVDFDGHHYQAKDCVIVPPGPRAEGIPLLIGASRPRMLRLTARYADAWNTAWLGDAPQLSERLERIQTACVAESRDSATLGITVGLSPVFPDLGEAEPWAKNPISGTVENLARAFENYEEVGADHLILQLTPSILGTLERVSDAVRLYRGASR